MSIQKLKITKRKYIQTYGVISYYFVEYFRAVERFELRAVLPSYIWEFDFTFEVESEFINFL
jgi:hypothetical protein